jgi:hypothetical protein
LSSTKVALNWLEAVTAEEGDVGNALVSVVSGHPAHAAIVEDGEAFEAGDVAVPGLTAKEEHGEHSADVGPSFCVWSRPSRSEEMAKCAKGPAGGHDACVDWVPYGRVFVPLGSEVDVRILNREDTVGAVGGDWRAVVVVGVVWFVLVDPVEAPTHGFVVGRAFVVVFLVVVGVGAVVPGDVSFRTASVFVREENPFCAVVEIEELISVL